MTLDNIPSQSPAVAPQTPDEIALTAKNLSQEQFITAIATKFGNFDAAVITQVLTEAAQTFRDVASKGGIVMLDGIGRFGYHGPISDDPLF